MRAAAAFPATKLPLPRILFYRVTSPSPIKIITEQVNATSESLIDEFNHLSHTIWVGMAIIVFIIISGVIVHRVLANIRQKGGIFLLFSLGQTHSVVKLRTLWLEPDIFEVKARGFSKLQIEQTRCVFKLLVEFDNHDVTNLITGETTLLTSTMFVNAWQAWRLRKLIDDRCHVIIMTKSADHVQTVRLLNNLSANIVPPSAPCLDNFSHSAGANTHHEITKGTSPLVTSIYPTMELKDIQVELIRQPNTSIGLPIFDRHVHARHTLH
jgi:hypothetical protein